MHYPEVSPSTPLQISYGTAAACTATTTTLESGSFNPNSPLMSASGQIGASGSLRLLTFIWRDDLWVYEAISWVLDPASQPNDPKFIRRGSIEIPFPKRIGPDGSIDFFFHRSWDTEGEIWMTASTPQKNQNNTVFKMARYLDVVSETRRPYSQDKKDGYTIVRINDYVLMQTKYDKFYARKFNAMSDSPWTKPTMRSAPPGRIGKWEEGLLIHPSLEFSNFDYVLNLNITEESGGDLWLSIDGLHTSHLDAWARGDVIYWKSTEICVPENLKIASPLARTVVLQSHEKKNQGKRLYFFIISKTRGRRVASFYIKLRDDGSLNTHSDIIDGQSLQWFQADMDLNSDFRVESTSNRVVALWSSDGKLTGKSAGVRDGVLSNDWVDFCNHDERPDLEGTSSIGSLMVPESYVSFLE